VADLLRESLREDDDDVGLSPQSPLNEALDSLLLALLHAPSTPFAIFVRMKELAIHSASIPVSPEHTSKGDRAAVSNCSSGRTRSPRALRAIGNVWIR